MQFLKFHAHSAFSPIRDKLEIWLEQLFSATRNKKLSYWNTGAQYFPLMVTIILYVIFMLKEKNKRVIFYLSVAISGILVDTLFLCYCTIGDWLQYGGLIMLHEKSTVLNCNVALNSPIPRLLYCSWLGLGTFLPKNCDRQKPRVQCVHCQQNIH